MTDSSFLRAIGSAPVLDRARSVAPIDTTGYLTDSTWAAILGLVADGAAVHVDDNSVRGLPAVERAVRLVSNSVASMMVAATEEAAEAVLQRPHPLFGAHEFYAMVVATAMRRGNFFGIIVGQAGDSQVIPVHNDVVSVDMSTGFPVYRIGGRVYSWREVLHVRANAEPGTFLGRGIIEKYRVPLAQALQEARYAETTYRTGGVPSGVVTLKQAGNVTQEQTDTVNDSWQGKFGNGNRKVAVLPEHMSFEPVAWSPHDAEFAEAQRISVAQAALMADLRPEDLGSSFGGSMTYANRSDDNLQRQTDSYQSWAEVLEQAFTDLVGRKVAADPAALLRMSRREAAEIEEIELRNELARRQLNAPTEEVTT